jgi:hypothetical protein
MNNSNPSPHPEPPVDLASWNLPLIEINEPLFRIHQTQHSPLYYGSSGNNRFDAPNGEYGVMYAAADANGAFIETFGSATGIRVVALSDLLSRSISELTCLKPLTLVDLTGAGLARLRADNRLCDGEHALAQRWALSLWKHQKQVDGIYYRARHDPSRYCAAIFDRARDKLVISKQLALNNNDCKSTLADILNTYEFGLV